MRFHHHDVRDMPQAILLACDVRRVMRAVLALLWTLAFVAALFLFRPWLPDSGIVFEPAMAEPANVWPELWEWAVIATGTLVWWLGFGYVNGSVVRTCAIELARNDRGRTRPEPMLYRMAAGAPLLAFALPLIPAAFVALWALLALIPGVAGAVILGLSVPLALLAALVAAFGLLAAMSAAPMMPACAVVEGRDYLEAVSRPIGYVLQKPFRYAAYLLAKAAVVVVAAIGGAAMLALAWLIVAGALWLVGAGSTVEFAYTIATAPRDVEVTEHAGSFVMASVFWASVICLAGWLSVVSQGCDVLTYLLMRYRIEGATFDQILFAEERMALHPDAVQTAEQAEEARRRFDARQPAPATAQAEQD